MKRSELMFLPEYYDRYINKCDDVELLEAIRTGINELEQIPIDKWRSTGDKVYAPGKWTIKDILQHLIDTERVFSFRALAFARGDKSQIPAFSEDEYAAAANSSERDLDELIAELKHLHLSVYEQFSSFTPAMLNRIGMGFKGKYSVASIGFILPGHQRWHFDVINEKYLGLE